MKWTPSPALLFLPVAAIVAPALAPVPVSLAAATLVMPSVWLLPLSVSDDRASVPRRGGATGAGVADQVTERPLLAALVLPATSVYWRVST